MKIAVCLKGQLRSGISASKSILNYLSDCDGDFDVFFHSWDITSNKRGDNSIVINPDIRRTTYEWIKSYNKIKVSNSDWQNLINIYNPKKYEIESYIDYLDMLKSQDTKDAQYDAFYSFWKSLQLKNQYEIETGIRYDYILSIRFDMVINHVCSIKETIKNIENINKNNINPSFFAAGVSDVILLDNISCKKIENYINPNGSFKNKISYNNADYCMIFLEFLRNNMGTAAEIGTRELLEKVKILFSYYKVLKDIGDSKINQDNYKLPEVVDAMLVLRPEVAHLDYINDYQLIMDEFYKDRLGDVFFNNVKYR
jgi:hypothetical protein